MRVLTVASEAYPLIKTGGLADVVGALPAAVAGLGVVMKVMLPGYPSVVERLKGTALLHYDNLYGGPASLVAGKAGGLDLIVLDAPHLFARPGNPYLGPDGRDWPDNWVRYAAFCRAATDIGRGAVAGFVPDVVHAHDWQAGLVPAFLHFTEEPKARTVVTIHNLAFQGHFGADIFPHLGLPAEAFAIHGVEYYGGVGYLKAGLQFADLLTTVSPTYAQEIMTPAGGMGLDGLLRDRRDVLFGIVNGIDTSVWDPASDSNLVALYTSASLGRRAANRREVESRFSLAGGDDPIFCIVSRLTTQKGMDLLAATADAFVAANARLAVLGAGDHGIEGALAAAAYRHPGRIGVVTGYHEPLAHLLQGGADAILIPSRFEPCGLTQFYGLRYGCVPVVARVGGLADTIIDANDAALAAGVATGLQFLPVDADGMLTAVRRAVGLFRDRAAWTNLQRRGMRADVSWARSAGRYVDLYKRLAGGR